MAVVNMHKEVTEKGEKGSIYTEDITLTGAGTSDTYILPAGAVYAICGRQENGVVSFSNDNPALIRAEDASVEWFDWDGAALINLAVTAFKFTWASGTARTVITVRTTWV